jgi:hypothetical protein
MEQLQSAHWHSKDFLSLSFIPHKRGSSTCIYIEITAKEQKHSHIRTAASFFESRWHHSKQMHEFAFDTYIHKQARSTSASRRVSLQFAVHRLYLLFSPYVVARDCAARIPLCDSILPTDHRSQPSLPPSIADITCIYTQLGPPPHRTELIAVQGIHTDDKKQGEKFIRSNDVLGWTV